MKMTRRQFSWAAAAGSAGLAVAKPSEYFVYIGGYTGPKNPGIQVWRFNPGSGQLTQVGLAVETPNPSFLAIHSSGKFLVAANEVGNFEGQRSGSVSSFRLDGSSGKLTPINTVASKGGGPCYVSFDPSGRFVLVANYGGGSIAVVPVGADGKLSDASAFVQHSGSGGDPKRQRGPHAHCIKPSPDGKFVLAADLGIDQLMVYRFSSGSLVANDPPSLKLKPGAGPRHFTFHPNGKMVYVINELDSTITSATWDAKTGAMSSVQSVSTLPDGFTSENSTAEIVIHPSGKLLFGSNRGHNSLAVFGLDSKGKMTPQGHVPTQGEIPRNFTLDPTNSYVFAANQKSDNVQLFKLDGSGKLTHTGKTIESVSPVCVRFAPAG